MIKQARIAGLTIVCLSLLDSAESKGQKVGSLSGGDMEKSAPAQDNKKTEIDFSGSYLDSDKLAQELNAAKKNSQAPQQNKNKEPEDEGIASEIEAYISKYAKYEEEKNDNGNGGIIYDKKSADAKLEREREKRIQLIKDMGAVTIYFVLGCLLLYIFYRGFKRYKGNTPVMVKHERQRSKADERIEMSNNRFDFKRAKTANFAKLTNEKSAKHSRNPSEVSKKSTQEPINPDDYDKEFVNVKKAAKLAQGENRRAAYHHRGTLAAKTQQFTLHDALNANPANRRITHQQATKKRNQTPASNMGKRKETPETLEHTPVKAYQTIN